ncbi:MAG: thioredoxin:protein disulfide reductase [Clostridiales bacterium]|nr:thioredoxin:protein disulfide reductase [Clostridiales bacterium]MDN5280977.1 thioredoxin:protein disulfide reductase [Candidatus Ozemobacter sp.]
MKSKIFAILAVLISLLPSLTFAQGDFLFKAGNSEARDNHYYAEVIAMVGKDHMLYRDQMKFSAENGKLEVIWPDIQLKKDPFTDEEVQVYAEGAHTFALKFFPDSTEQTSFTIKVNYQGCSNQTCFFPTSQDFKFHPSIVAKKASAPTSLPQETDTRKVESTGVQTPGGLVDFAATLKDQGIMVVLLLSLLGGLLISLTPCVYPMIPITLSIIGSRDENQSFYKGLGLSATYVAGLSITYALLGLAAATFGAQIRSILQGTVFQAAIAIIFLLLAFSMFDVFMIQAPGSLRNRLGSVKKAGLFGIFLMGMVSGLMASPCVAAPLAGILAFIAATGSQMLGFLMLLFFAWGMSLPLLLIGAFSGTLNALPKAGEWMNRVKEFYGFLLLGASLYFAQPLIGEPWTELALALVLAAFAAYLGLFSNLPEDSLLSHRVFKAFGVVTMAVACAFAISATTKWGCLILPDSQNSVQAKQLDSFWYYDLAEAKKAAADAKKPIFVDFRADWCTICRELEENVFPRPEISSLLNKMVPVKIDATKPDKKTEELISRYSVVGLPTLLLLSPDGEEFVQIRMVGDISPGQLEKNLRQALANNQN